MQSRSAKSYGLIGRFVGSRVPTFVDDGGDDRKVSFVYQTTQGLHEDPVFFRFSRNLKGGFLLADVVLVQNDEIVTKMRELEFL